MYCGAANIHYGWVATTHRDTCITLCVGVKHAPCLLFIIPFGWVSNTHRALIPSNLRSPGDTASCHLHVCHVSWTTRIHFSNDNGKPYITFRLSNRSNLLLRLSELDSQNTSVYLAFQISTAPNSNSQTLSFFWPLLVCVRTNICTCLTGKYSHYSYFIAHHISSVNSFVRPTRTVSIRGE